MKVYIEIIIFFTLYMFYGIITHTKNESNVEIIIITKIDKSKLKSKIYFDKKHSFMQEPICLHFFDENKYKVGDKLFFTNSDNGKVNSYRGFVEKTEIIARICNKITVQNSDIEYFVDIKYFGNGNVKRKDNKVSKEFFDSCKIGDKIKCNGWRRVKFPRNIVEIEPLSDLILELKEKK